MAKPVSRKIMRLEAPAWVFNWRQRRESPWQKLFATLAVAGVFAFFLTSIRIHVVPPTPWATHKASVIHLTEDAEGRALTLRAREDGPFPSRFEPAAWEIATAMEQAAMDATRWSPPPYVPALRDLAAQVTPRVMLASHGVPTLPKPRLESQPTPPAVTPTLAPMLFPLSGITAAAMPRKLPPFPRAVDASMTAEVWRFLLRVDSAGNVMDCVSLAGGDEAGPRPLEDWLRRVPFIPDPGKTIRWMAVGVEFTNQPAHGPDAH